MIEVKTILNANLMRKFNTEQTKSRMWLPFALTLLFVALGVIGFFADWGTLVSVLLIVIGVLVPFAYALTAHLLMSHMLKNAPTLQNETTQIWHFLDNKIILHESSKSMSPHDSQLTYDSIYKVVERQSAFYLYTARNTVYILDIKGFAAGSRRDLHDMLLVRIGKRLHFSKKIYAKK